MIVICCGMPRAASTLQYQIVCELIERTGRGTRPSGWPTPIDPDMAAAPDPIHAAKVHDPDPDTEQRLNPAFTRYIYVYRDVRDAIASYIQKDGDVPPDRIAELTQRRFLDPFAHFTSRRNVLVSRYESITRSIAPEVRRIARFIDLDIPADEPDRIAATLDLDAQRRHIQSLRWTPDQRWDDRTLLHRNHINDARIGKFRDVLSPEQIEEIERVARPWLTSRGYRLATAA